MVIIHLYYQDSLKEMKDIQKIIEAESGRLDQELFKDCLCMRQFLGYQCILVSSAEPSTSASQNNASPDIEIPPIFEPMDNRDQSKQSLPNNIQAGSTVFGQAMNPLQQQHEIEAFQQSQQSQYVIGQQQKNRKGVWTYEANNLLPKARGPHLSFLKERFKEKIYSYSIINKLEKANTASRQDFLELYNIPEFYDAFDDFFKNKVLYRAIMMSGCEMKNKKIFLKRLHIFEEAYRSKIFSAVNRKENRVSRNNYYRQQ